MSLRPFIFIGVGGTGGQVLGVIRQNLSDTLKSKGWRDDLPKGWQFLHIDVPANPDAKPENAPYALARTQYLPLTDSKSTYQAYAKSLTQRVDRNLPDDFARYQAWNCWRPSPDQQVKTNIVNGAGQFRAIGRVCVQVRLTEVQTALETAYVNTKDANVARQFAQVQSLLGVTAPSADKEEPAIFVIGSVAGGSGSGMFLDVCNLLRAKGHNEIYALLFTPEVFADANGELDPGIAPNTFMALNELANGMWTTSDSPLASNFLFDAAGQGGARVHSGPSSVLLVGRRNGSVSFEKTADIYKIVGRSLAELALDEDLTRDVISHDITNGQSAEAGRSDVLGLSTPNAPRDLANFRSLGFSRLDVGRDFFETYATDRMTRAVILRLLDAHLLRKDPGSTLTNDELLQRAVTAAWEPFLHASRLDEKGKSANEITKRLSSLADPGVGAAKRELQVKLHQAVRSVAVKGRVKATDAGSKVAESAAAARGAILRAGLAAVGAHALELQAELQQNLSQIVAERIARDGLPVTSALLDRLVAQCTEARTSLTADVVAANAKERDALNSLRTGNAALEAEFPLTASDKVDKLLDQANRAMDAALEAQYHQAASGLLLDIIDHLLKPWRRALEDADALLRHEARPANQISLLDIWPTGDVPGEPENIPDYIRPSKVEFLLDTVDDFPANFRGLIDTCVEGLSGLSAVQKAVQEVAAGINLSKAADVDQSLAVVEYLMPWRPEWDLARDPRHDQGSAQIKLHLTIKDIRARAREWLWDDRKNSNQYLRTTLNGYLTDPSVGDAERNQREARLLAQFEAMLRTSLPLVAIDPQMAQLIHDETQPAYNVHLTPLNVPQGLAQKLSDIAQVQLGTPQKIDITTDPRADATMMTVLAGSYHTVEIASVMEPLANQWALLAQTKASVWSGLASSSDFWQWRRSRPLPEWVPLAPGALMDLVRGWFMARLTGHARVSPDGTQLLVRLPGNHQFDTITTSGVRAATSVDQVGMLVESLAISQITAYQSRDLAPFQPYRSLIGLGATCFQPSATGNELIRWVQQGGDADPELYDFACDLDSNEGRQSAALSVVDQWRESYGEDTHGLDRDPRRSQMHPTIELNEVVMGALEQIKDRLSADPVKHGKR